MSLIECEHTSFAYEGKTVLSDVSFAVNEGDYLTVVGENGAGKSTLIKGLLRLKNPAMGKIIYGDGLNADEIGYLPQQTEVQKDFPASVYEVVLSGCLNRLGNHIFYPARLKKLADENIHLLGIEGLKNRCYRELSGGQQQRVLLARAMCATRKLLVLDEPVTGLDPVIAGELYDIIREIHETQGITIIMISHDVRGAVREADHILHIAGEMKYFGSSEAYRKDPAGAAFLKGDCG
jgi:zinc transport system ATP-binding protein